MKRLLHIASSGVLLAGVFCSMLGSSAGAAFDQNIVIDDVVFNDTGSMSIAQIDDFLNTKGSCLSTSSGFSAPDPTGYSPSGGFTYGSNVSAGTVIGHAGQVFGLNPQVLLVTLQKEQSLITSTTCTTDTIAKAVGYGCPDSPTSNSYAGLNLYTRNGTTYTSVNNTCVNSASKAGFSQQIIRAAWLLKFSQQRALGNVGWAIIQGSWDNSDDLSSCYSGYMTQGSFKRCPNDTPIFFDGWASIDGTAVHMNTGAAAALYRYTPHFHGNQVFVSVFESWFGSTISALYYSCHNATNVAGIGSGDRIVANRLAGTKNDTLSLVIPNNTGSACAEIHTWVNASAQAWFNNIATNHPAVDPHDDEIISADMDGDGRSEFYLIKYRNTGSGNIEVHRWDDSKQHWFSNIATNHPAVDPADNRIIAADTNGDGKDELLLIKYRNNGSGHVEVHTWAPGEQSWVSNLATNHPEVDPADDRVIAADTNGDGKDELLFVKYRNTGSGHVEVHTWAPGEQSWVSNLATNHPEVDPADNEVVSADVNGDGADELLFVKYRNTGSGHVEVHTWAPGEQSWVSNLATNVPSMN